MQLLQQQRQSTVAVDEVCYFLACTNSLLMYYFVLISLYFLECTAEKATMTRGKLIKHPGKPCDLAYFDVMF
ncbi:hypothetical protein F383_21869 [Gossypium arboreum]|uniref:Uncharacterized protein n=1 Tax=Gossypium arboreum TaxID=29729 RepID=A0A0B0NX59_GOSAR|nr:hypothetical protein F383_21869 [Gossypium arboreum]